MGLLREPRGGRGAPWGPRRSPWGAHEAYGAPWVLGVQYQGSLGFKISTPCGQAPGRRWRGSWWVFREIGRFSGKLGGFPGPERPKVGFARIGVHLRDKLEEGFEYQTCPMPLNGSKHVNVHVVPENPPVWDRTPFVAYVLHFVTFCCILLPATVHSTHYSQHVRTPDAFCTLFAAFYNPALCILCTFW